MKKYISILVSILLIAFGSLTFFLSSSLIFDLFNMRHNQENFAPFVAWANLVSGSIYLVSAFGLMYKKKWTVKVLMGAVAILLITFVAYNFYLSTDGMHLEKTWGALIFIISVTIVFTISAYFLNSKGSE